MLKWLSFFLLLFSTALSNAEASPCTVMYSRRSPPERDVPEVTERRAMANLDAILAEAGSVPDFLKNRTLRDHYFYGLREYFGADKINPAQYQAVLSQLQNLIDKVPGLADRLWETEKMGTSIGFQTSRKTYGRNLAINEWSNHFKQWLKSLRAESGQWIKLEDSSDKKFLAVEFTKAFQTFSDRHQSHLLRLARSTRRADREKVAAAYYSELNADTDWAQLKKAWLYLFLNQVTIRDQFSSGDADLILDRLKHMREFPTRSVDIEGFPPLPDFLKSQIKSEIPPLKEWLAREDIFPIRKRVSKRGTEYAEGSNSVSEFEFLPLARRFHGIFKGIPLGECVGGHSDHLYNLSPERWATIAIAQTIFLNIERNGEYLGFIQIIPVRINGKRYGSIELGAPVLRNKLWTTNDQNEIVPQLLIEKLLPQLIRMASQHGLRGLAVAETSNAINNAGVLTALRSLNAFRFSSPISYESRKSILEDPLAYAISQASPEGSRWYGKPNSVMIFDAGETHRVVRLTNYKMDPRLTVPFLKTISNSPEESQRLDDALRAFAQNTKPFSPELYRYLLSLNESAVRYESEYHLLMHAVQNLRAADPSNDKLLHNLLEIPNISQKQIAYLLRALQSGWIYFSNPEVLLSKALDLLPLTAGDQKTLDRSLSYIYLIFQTYSKSLSHSSSLIYRLMHFHLIADKVLPTESYAKWRVDGQNNAEYRSFILQTLHDLIDPKIKTQAPKWAAVFRVFQRMIESNPKLFIDEVLTPWVSRDSMNPEVLIQIVRQTTRRSPFSFSDLDKGLSYRISEKSIAKIFMAIAGAPNADHTVLREIIGRSSVLIEQTDQMDQTLEYVMRSPKWAPTGDEHIFFSKRIESNKKRISEVVSWLDRSKLKSGKHTKIEKNIALLKCEFALQFLRKKRQLLPKQANEIIKALYYSWITPAMIRDIFFIIGTKKVDPSLKTAVLERLAVLYE